MTPAERRAIEQRMEGMRAQWWRAKDGRRVLIGLTYQGRPADFDRLTSAEHQCLMDLVAKVHGITDSKEPHQ